MAILRVYMFDTVARRWRRGWRLDLSSHRICTLYRLACQGSANLLLRAEELVSL